MLCAPPVADLAAIFAVPCCLAEITAAGYALYLPREAGCTDGIRAVLAPFHGHFSTPLRCPAVPMPRVQAVLCYHIAVRHVKLQRIAFWHIDMVHLFQKMASSNSSSPRTSVQTLTMFLWLMVPPTGQPVPFFFSSYCHSSRTPYRHGLSACCAYSSDRSMGI